ADCGGVRASSGRGASRKRASRNQRGSGAQPLGAEEIGERRMRAQLGNFEHRLAAAVGGAKSGVPFIAGARSEERIEERRQRGIEGSVEPIRSPYRRAEALPEFLLQRAEDIAPSAPARASAPLRAR